MTNNGTFTLETKADGWNYLAETDWIKAISGQSDRFHFERMGLHYAMGMADLMPRKMNNIVMDLGCGVGRTMKHLAFMCKEIHGVDCSQVMIDLSKEYLSNSPNASVHLAIDESLSEFQNNSFDFVYAIGTFIHCDFDEIKRYMVSIIRILRPNCMLYCDIHMAPTSPGVTVPHLNSNRVIQTSPLQIAELADMWKSADVKLVKTRCICKFVRN